MKKLSTQSKEERSKLMKRRDILSLQRRAALGKDEVS